MSVKPSSFLIRCPLIIRRLDRDILFAFNECYEVLFAQYIGALLWKLNAGTFPVGCFAGAYLENREIISIFPVGSKIVNRMIETVLTL